MQSIDGIGFANENVCLSYMRCMNCFGLRVGGTLTVVVRRHGAHATEETFVKELQQLQGALVNRRSRASGAHQRYIDDGRVMVTRIFPDKQQ